MRKKTPEVPFKGTTSLNVTADQQPNSTRQSVMLLNCKLLMVGAFVTAPLALWVLSTSIIVPFIVVMLAMAGTFIAYAQTAMGKSIHAASTLVFMGMLIGLLLGLAEPGFVDFGFASILLGPVLAALIGNKEMQRGAWILTLSAIVLIAMFGGWVSAALPLDLLTQQRQGISAAAVTFYSAFAAIVGLTAHRIGTSQRRYETAQVDTFRQLIEHVQHAVIRISTEGEPEYISSNSEKLFGCKRYELSRTGLIDRMHVQDKPKYMTAVSDANRGGIARTVEVRMRKDDVQTSATTPQYIWVEISISPVLLDDPEQSNHELILLLRDISHRKVQEENIKEAQRIAQDASDAKSKFLATIGHELRTPLNAIVGFSEMMTNNIAGKMDDGPREYAEIIHKSGLHLLDVVNMLLDMSRIEAGKFELQPEPFMPDELLGPCIEMVDQFARERQIKIKAEQPTHLPTIIGDQRACRQVLINLLSNAVKFSTSGGEVRVSIKRQGADLNISVADDGIGMTQDVLERIGEPFYQANAGTARTHEGAGLGLSIVKGLIELHDGHLRITSEPGRGTTMTVLLPLAGPKMKLEPEQIVTPLKPKSATGVVALWDDRKSAAS